MESIIKTQYGAYFFLLSLFLFILSFLFLPLIVFGDTTFTSPIRCDDVTTTPTCNPYGEGRLRPDTDTMQYYCHQVVSLESGYVSHTEVVKVHPFLNLWESSSNSWSLTTSGSYEVDTLTCSTPPPPTLFVATSSLIFEDVENIQSYYLWFFWYFLVFILAIGFPAYLIMRYTFRI